MTVYRCRYCIELYETTTIKRWVSGNGYQRSHWESGPQRFYCSVGCRKRGVVWDRWIRDSRAAVIGGDVNKPANLGPLLPSMTGVSEAVSRYQGILV